MCYDFWKNFNKLNVETNIKKDMKQFIRYSLYVWPITVVATAVCIFVELSSSVDATYKPGFGEIVCWLQFNNRTAWFYLFGPSFLIIFLNLVAFIRFLTIFYKTRRDAARLRRNQKIFKENILIIVRLLLVLGIPRFFIIISYFIPKGSSGDLFTTIADLINVVQGILVFSCFVLRPKVWHLVIKRLCGNSTTV
ncbi:G-protein coupled receptor Mth2-like [Lucilia cuprina]|uniref:G-protein coupled receptor Mth2-like n=1 Tax=Lucilia cuprina TaxID=7375 RepID=UPI001F054696|nr:G-protein coupled receptor Mth2-like [Lucilia cuprina]